MTSRRLAPTAPALALCLAAASASAQVDPLSTTAGLKAACEASAGKAIVISSDTTVNIGYPADSPEPVRTGCRIELKGGATIQFDKVGLAFAGPLVIAGDTKSGLQMQEASLAGARVLLELTASENSIKMEYSRVEATAGHLDLRMGTGAKIEVVGARGAGVPLPRAAFAASGDIGLASSSRYSAVFKDTGMVAGGTIAMTAAGLESSVGFENSVAQATRGDIRFDLTSSKSKLETGNAGFTAAAGSVSLAIRGSESVLKASNTALAAGGSAQILSAAPKTEVHVGGGSIVAGGGILLEAYTAGFDGTLSVNEVQMNGGGNVDMLTGLRGKTMVFGNRIAAAGTVRAATDTWGVCEASSNQVAAHGVQLCP